MTGVVNRILFSLNAVAAFSNNTDGIYENCVITRQTITTGYITYRNQDENSASRLASRFALGRFSDQEEESGYFLNKLVIKLLTS